MHLFALGLLAAVLAQSTAAPTTRQSIDPATLGPRVGAALPAFELRDQDGHLRDFSSLAGPQGLVLVFFRSADW